MECLEGKAAERQLFAAVQEHIGGHSCQLFKHRCIGAMRHNFCACLLAEESDIIYVIEVSVGNEHVAQTKLLFLDVLQQIVAANPRIDDCRFVAVLVAQKVDVVLQRPPHEGLHPHGVVSFLPEPTLLVASPSAATSAADGFATDA